MSSIRGNNVCRTCLSTEGELISLFSETCQVSDIPKKIISMSNAEINKNDGLPDKICRKCIYLLELFYCFKDQLISADKRLRNGWTAEEETNGKDVSQNELTPGQNEEGIHTELTLSQNEEVIHAELTLSQNEEVIHNELTTPSQNEKVIHNELTTPSQNEKVIHNELDYDIEWISDKVRIEVEKAFRRKFAKEDKKKLQETCTSLKSTETQVSLLRKDIWNKPIKSEKPADIFKDDIVKTKKPKDIKNNIAKCEEPKDVTEDDIHKTEEPKDIKDDIHKTKEPKDTKDDIHKTEEPKDVEDNIIKSEELKDAKNNILKSTFEDIEDNAVKSEDPEVSMEEDASDSQNHEYTVKHELLQNEELNDTLQSDKSDDGRCTNEAKEKEDVIVISDSSDEADSSYRPQAALTPVPMDSLGAAGNGAYTISIVSPMYPNGRQVITIPRVPPRAKNVAGFEKKKESLCREAANVEKTSASFPPRRFFQCTRCNVNLYTVAAVLLHHNQVHTPNKASLCCLMCDKSFPAKSSLFEHFNQHIESHLFRCSFCPNEFVMKKNLVEHMKTHKKRAGLVENRSANKRVRVSSGNSMEGSRAAKQRASKKYGSPIAPKDSEDSGKENIDTADPRMPLTENLNEDPVKEPEEDDTVVAAKPAAPVVQSADEHRMEQEEELTGNENQMVIDSEASVIQSPDNFVVDQ